LVGRQLFNALCYDGAAAAKSFGFRAAASIFGYPISEDAFLSLQSDFSLSTD